MTHPFLRSLTAVLLVALLSGCPSGKVLREDFSRMERIEISEAGLSFLFVPGAVGPEDRGSDRIFVRMHYVDEFPAIGQDAVCMFQLYFKKRESPWVAEKLGQGIEFQYGEGAPAGRLVKALRCPNGELWLLEIEIGRYSIDGHDYFEEDIEVARRILESVECIGDSALAASE